MISIRESLAELEKVHLERDTAVDCYVKAIQNLAHYTIDLEPEITEPQRRFLNSLAEEAASGKSEVLDETQASLRGLLREYRDKVVAYMRRLREELDGVSRAMEQVLSSFAQTDGEQETILQEALGRLRDVSRSPAASPIRGVLVTVVETIDTSLEEIRKEHQLTVSQLRVEMSVLHKRIDSLEAAASVDQLTEFFNRREMEEKIRSGPAAGSLLLVQVVGFRLAEIHFRKEVAAELTAAFSKRLRTSLPKEAVISRWGNEEFVAMLAIPGREAGALSKTLAEQMSGAYVCLMNVKAVHPKIQASVAVVEAAGAPPEKILQRISGFFPSAGKG